MTRTEAAGTTMTRIFKRGVLLGALAFLACGGKELTPNGDKQVLFFGGVSSSLGEGLSRVIELPRQATVSNGCGKLDLVCDRKTFTYDFDGTSLEVTPPQGVQVASSALGEKGYAVTLTCVNALPDGVGPVNFRVLDGAGAVRYEDSTSIHCEKADALQLSADHPHYAIGAPVLLGTKLVKGDRTLDGIGWSIHDPQNALERNEPGTDGGDTAVHSAFSFKAVAAGGGASVSAGTVTAPMPFDVVPDSAWTLAMDVSPCSSTQIRASLSAQLSDGAAVGLPESGCTFSSRDADGGTSAIQSYGGCAACLEAPAQGTLCVTLSGHDACKPYGR